MQNDYLNNLKFKSKIIVFKDNLSFGQGIARIMSLVKETNRLSEAYKIMGLSSSKGWKIIKRAEEDLGFPLFITVVGGKNGGQSTLSPEGEELLRRYNNFAEELNIESKRIFKKYFPD